MTLRQARPIKSLDQSIMQDLTIVLHMPKQDQLSLSTLFDNIAGEQIISAEQAKMQELSVWAKPPRKNGKIYGDIDTDNWQDFEEKLNRIILKKKFQKTLIEYEGRITNANNAFLRPENTDVLIQNLKAQGHGDALYSDNNLSIAFPRLSFNSKTELTVYVPYVKKDENELHRVFLHTPDQKIYEEYHDHFGYVNES